MIEVDLVAVLIASIEAARENRTLPIHRTEAGYLSCSTCEGGGCPDCTDGSNE